MSSRDKFQKPKSQDFYKGAEAENYVEVRKGKKTWVTEQKIVEKYLDKFSDVKSVLDVPFGTGRYVPLYIKKNLEINGVEISPAMVTEAKRILGNDFSKCNIIIGNSINIPFEDGRFDLLVCAGFLAAIIAFDEVIQSLREFARVTKKYFMLEIGQRHTNNPRPRLPNGNEKMAFWFYPNEIQQMLMGVGIEVIETKPVLDDLHIYICRKV